MDGGVIKVMITKNDLELVIREYGQAMHDWGNSGFYCSYEVKVAQDAWNNVKELLKDIRLTCRKEV